MIPARSATVGRHRRRRVALIVEPDAELRGSLRDLLAAHDWNVVDTGTHSAGVEELRRGLPDIVVVDPDLPDGDGLDILGETLGRSIALIVLCTRTAEADKVAALDRGADDYLTKPFGPHELMARIRAVMRRATPVQGDVVDIGPIRIDPVRREVRVAGDAVHLTPIEFSLLARLARSPGIVVERGQLLRDVWGGNAVDSHHYLRVHVASLRKKLEVDPGRPKWLCTVNGVGYRLGLAGATDP